MLGSTPVVRYPAPVRDVGRQHHVDGVVEASEQDEEGANVLGGRDECDLRPAAQHVCSML